MANKANGERCTLWTRTLPGADGVRRCGIHARVFGNELEAQQRLVQMHGPPVAGRCNNIVLAGRCNEPVHENGMCRWHAMREHQLEDGRLRRREARAARAVGAAEIGDMVLVLINAAIHEVPIRTWDETVSRWFRLMINNQLPYAAFSRASIELCGMLHPERHARTVFRMIENELRRAEPLPLAAAAGGNQVPPPPVQRLGAVARDAQNVHTRFVSEQTNRGLERLLAVPVPKEQATCIEIGRMWLDRPPKRISMGVFLSVMADVNLWYKTSTCKTISDFLYKRALDGLWATISQTKDDGIRIELNKRLRQELLESNKMCCEGHISRLVNVMVGFDDNFQQAIPVGEILQQKMGSIAAMGLETADAVVLARKVLAELAIPEEQHNAWLDAF